MTSPNFARTGIMNKFREELVKRFSSEVVLCEDVFYEIYTIHFRILSDRDI
jgi:hypothetical protein